jgi:hypothetical protein
MSRERPLPSTRFVVTATTIASITFACTFGSALLAAYIRDRGSRPKPCG